MTAEVAEFVEGVATGLAGAGLADVVTGLGGAGAVVAGAAACVVTGEGAAACVVAGAATLAGEEET